MHANICICKQIHILINLSISISIYRSLYIYVCVCMCVFKSSNRSCEEFFLCGSASLQGHCAFKAQVPVALRPLVSQALLFLFLPVSLQGQQRSGHDQSLA